MEKFENGHSSELLKLENEEASVDCHLSKLLSVKKQKPDGILRTQRLTPSSVLDRVKLFIPDLKEANKNLQINIENGSANDYNIENVDDMDEKVIEMNLAVVHYGESSSDLDSDGDSTSDDNESSDDTRITTDTSTINRKKHVLIRPATES